MVDPVSALGFGRLRDLLESDGGPEKAKLARKTAMGQNLERIALSHGFPARIRLAALASLSRSASKSALPARDRADIAAELDRLAMRILWHENLLENPPGKPRPPLVIAQTLLEVAAAGLLPDGPVGKTILERARTLLRNGEAAKAMADPALRARFADLLERAYAAVRIDRAERSRVIPLSSEA